MSPLKLGIFPVNLFSIRVNSRRSVRPLRSGIVPLNSLFRRFMYCRLVRLPRSEIVPLNSLYDSSRRVRPVRPLRSGIVPVNWLLDRRNSRKLMRLPNSSGRVPTRLFLISFSFITRSLLSVVTPDHVPMGSAVAQLVRVVQFSPPVLLYSAISAPQSGCTDPWNTSTV